MAQYNWHPEVIYVVQNSTPYPTPILLTNYKHRRESCSWSYNNFALIREYQLLMSQSEKQMSTKLMRTYFAIYLCLLMAGLLGKSECTIINICMHGFIEWTLIRNDCTSANVHRNNISRLQTILIMHVCALTHTHACMVKYTCMHIMHVACMH